MIGNFCTLYDFVWILRVEVPEEPFVDTRTQMLDQVGTSLWSTKMQNMDMCHFIKLGQYWLTQHCIWFYAEGERQVFTSPSKP